MASLLQSSESFRRQIVEVNGSVHLIEERVFQHRRDLFARLDLVFADTTSLAFAGAVGLQPTGLPRGSEMLGRYGYSKDHRPDLRQIILAVVLDGAGRPVCSEVWPGNTADVTGLMPVVDRLQKRFSIFFTLREAQVLIEAWRVHYNPASQHPSVYCIEENRFSWA